MRLFSFRYVQQHALRIDYVSMMHYFSPCLLNNFAALFLESFTKQQQQQHQHSSAYITIIIQRDNDKVVVD